jgi:hypothetical protein
MKMLADVAMTGYTMMSGSNPFLNETKATLMVTKENNRPIANVETVTERIDGKSVSLIPKNKLPKNNDMTLTVKLVIKVKTMIPWSSL